MAANIDDRKIASTRAQASMRTYRREIDGLRAIAITSVVLYHAFGERFSGGYIGVDIFFVISGYLITSIILDDAGSRQFSFKSFYARRARRILPALLAMSVATSIIAATVFTPEDLIEYGKMLIYTQVFSANFRLAATPGYFAPSMQENPLLHMWSLSVEEQFYLVWPILLLVMLRLLSPRRVLIATVVLCVASLLTAESLVHLWPRSAFFHLPTRGWELLVGASLAFGVIPKLRSGSLAELLSAAGLLCMVVPVFLYTQATPVPGFFAAIPVFGCVLVLYATSSFSSWVAKGLSCLPVVFIGMISYSLYLWHWPILSFAAYILARPLTTNEGLVCAGAAVAVSALSWRYIEQPFRRTKSLSSLHSNVESFPKLSLAAYAALVLTVFLIGCGSLFQESKGAPWRFSAEARELFRQHTRANLNACLTRTSKLDRIVTCQFGELNSTEVVLWGDSHARAIMPLVTSTYRSGRAYFTTGCSSLMTQVFLSIFPGTTTSICAENNDYVFSEILKTKPKILFLASRWDGVDGFASQPTKSQFDQFLVQMLGAITKNGTKVVILRQVPKLKNATVPCLLRSTALGLISCEDSISRIEAEQSQSNITRSFADVARINADIFVFDPFPNFCDNSRCFAFQQQKLAYFDADHLSILGALALIDPLKRSLPEAFRLGSLSTPL